MIDSTTPGIDVDPPDYFVCNRCVHFKPIDSNEREATNCETWASLDAERCPMVSGMDTANTRISENGKV